MSSYVKFHLIMRPLVALSAAAATMVAGGSGAAARISSLGSSSSTVTAAVLRDITDLPRSGGGASVAVGGELYFVLSDDSWSYLWRSDGTSAGTVRLHRFVSAPSFLTGCGDKVFFWTDDGAHGEELWRTDGSAAGTALVRDLRPGRYDSTPVPLFPLGDQVYFRTSHGLYRSDGTEAGTVLVRSLPEIGAMAVVNGTLYFGSTGRPTAHLWRSDGTTAGTDVVTDFAVTGTTIDAQELSDLTAVNGRLAFTSLLQVADADGDLSIARVELWISDGTSAGTRQLHSFNDSVYEISASGGGFYFTEAARALWRSDGSPGGTVRVYRAANSWINELTDVGGQLLFLDNGGLYRSDGTAAGTRRILAGVEPGDFSPVTAVGDHGFFLASTSAVGEELWTTDGTTGGSRLVYDLNPGKDGSLASALTDVNGKLFFVASVHGRGTSLWTTTPSGTRPNQVRVLDNGTVGSGWARFARVGTDLYFNATTWSWTRSWDTDSDSAEAVWRTDGTVTQTVWQAPDPDNPGSVWSLTAQGDRAFLSADDGLWVLQDGHAKQLVASPSFEDWGAWGITPAGSSTVYFVARAGETGARLWRSDGTVRGTRVVSRVVSGPDSDYLEPMISQLTPVGSRVLFTANDNIHGTELWTSNGTARGTHMVKNIRTGGPSRVAHLTRIGRTVYFTANDGKHGQELWKSDGTAAGTVMVRDIRKNGSSTPRWLTNVNGTLMFSANDGVHGRELWRSDGTRVGTRMVKDTRPGSLSTWPGQLTAVGKNVFFTAYDSHGRELWVSDGTRSGTKLVKDIRPGERTVALAPRELARIGNRLVFAARDATHGTEPWITDGTAAGTFMISDVNPRYSSWPRGFAYTHGKLVFDADDGTHGFEPMVVPWPRR